MKTLSTKPSCYPIVLAALLVLVTRIVAQSATITWTNTAGGNWSVSSNWNPNQVPTNTDNVRVTAPGTYMVVLDIGGVGFSFSVQPLSLIVGAGGGASGVQTFAMTNHAFIAGSIVVTNGGVFNVAGDSFYLGSNMVVNGGIFNPTVVASFTGGGSLILNPLIITNGGTVNASGHTLYLSTFGGAVTVANGGRLRTSSVAVGPSMTVATGGVVDAIAELYISNPLMNSGTLNLTNTTVYIYNDVANGTGGGIVNQAGGVINLRSNAFVYSGTGATSHGFFLNSGTVTASDAPGSSISVMDFNNTLGTVTNLSGTLMLGLYQTNLSGKYGAAAGTTIQFAGANNPAPVTPGTPLTLSGNGNFQFTSGYLRLPTDSIPKLALLGTTLELGPAFQGGSITNLTLNGITFSNTLPIAGSFAATNGILRGDFTVNNGGSFNLSNVTFFNTQLKVNAGGQLNFSGPLSLLAPLTNAGTINLSNASLLINAGTLNGVVNKAGGTFNFSGTNRVVQSSGSLSYFLNQGSITELAGPGTLLSVSNFDNSLGSVTNLGGVLTVGNIQSSLAGIFNAAAGAINQIFAANTNTQLALGTPLAFSGAGANRLMSGFLTLTTNTIPHLGLFGSTLQLGAGFQGGAITNLSLNGIKLTNNLPVTGTFSVTNSPVFGSFQVAGSGVLSADNASFFGALTIASGGRLDITNNVRAAGPITNSGTMRIFDFSLLLPDNNGSNSSGALLNQSGGTVDFAGDYAGMFSWLFSGAQDYLVNKGQMIKSVGTGLSAIGLTFATNFGNIVIHSGIMQLNPMTLQPGSSLGVWLNSATNFGTIQFYSGQTLGGSFNVTLDDGYVPIGGSSFTVLSYASYANNFTSINLPSAVTWQTTLGSTNLTLFVTGGGSGQPQFIPLTLVGTNLIFNGTGGSPGSNYIVLTSTNVALPLASWSPVTTNKFDGSGNFKYTNSVTPAKPRQFFILKLP